MKTLNYYIFEKLIINKDTKVNIDVTSTFKEGDICLMITDWKTAVDICLVKIHKIDFENQKIYILGEYQENPVFSGKGYQYDFLKNKRNDNINVLHVSSNCKSKINSNDDIIFVSQNIAKEVLENVMKNNLKIDFNYFLNKTSNMRNTSFAFCYEDKDKCEEILNRFYNIIKEKTN